MMGHVRDHMRVYVLLGAVAWSCGACSTGADESATTTTTDPNLDEDGDGLSSAQEEEYGTDPGLADSDGDGYVDGEEIDGHTDPLDPNDHPYAGGWAIGACRDEIQGAGYAEGDTATDFGLADQFGDTIRLHSFCDRAVLLVGAAFW